MVEDSNSELELLGEMTKKGRQRAEQETIVPRRVGFVLSVLGGLCFIFLVEGRKEFVGLFVLVFLLILGIHYVKAKAWPYFWPSRGLLDQAKRRIRVTPAYVVYVIFGICFAVSLPFLVILAMEFKGRGYAWTSYAGGVAYSGPS